MDVNFVWENENKSNDIIKVELLLAKALAIFADPFADYDSKKNGEGLTRHVMRQATESLANIYAVTVNDLPLGVYHYLFLIKTAEGAWLELSANQKSTILGSRRKVNYIELDPTSPKSVNSFSDCIDENTPLMHSNVNKPVDSSTKPKKRFGGCFCCTR